MFYPIALAIVIFSIVATLYISYHVRKHAHTTEGFYVAGGKISWRMNGAAMLGDFCSAASFLGIAGAISLMGIDGWWIALGFFAGWISVLLLVAGPLKSAGKFTMGDVLVARFGESKRVKTIAMLATIILCTLYLVPQLVGAGHLFELLLGWDYLWTVFLTGILMSAFVIIGGMKGTTISQAVQGVMLFGTMIAIVIIVAVVHFGGNPLGIVAESHVMVPPEVVYEQSGEVPGAAAMLSAAREAVSPVSTEMVGTAREMMPGAPSALTPGVGLKDVWNQFSLVLALFLGVLGLPHILMRFYTVGDARAAQKSAELTIWGLAIFYAATLLVGLAAMYLIYPTLLQYLTEPGGRGIATNMAVPILGKMLGGEVLLGIIAAGALAAMLSTCTGLLITATTSIAHDVYAGMIKPHSSDKERVLFAKFGTGVLTIVAIGMAIWLRDENVGILVGMSFGIAASTFAPVLVSCLWWRSLTRQGVVIGMGVGLVSSLLFTFAKFAGLETLFGIPVLINPALYSVPAAVLALVIATNLTKGQGKEDFMSIAHR